MALLAKTPYVIRDAFVKDLAEKTGLVIEKYDAGIHWFYDGDTDLEVVNGKKFSKFTNPVGEENYTILCNISNFKHDASIDLNAIDFIDWSGTSARGAIVAYKKTDGEVYYKNPDTGARSGAKHIIRSLVTRNAKYNQRDINYVMPDAIEIGWWCGPYSRILLWIMLNYCKSKVKRVFAGIVGGEDNVSSMGMAKAFGFQKYTGNQDKRKEEYFVVLELDKFDFGEDHFKKIVEKNFEKKKKRGIDNIGLNLIIFFLL